LYVFDGFVTVLSFSLRYILVQVGACVVLFCCLQVFAGLRLCLQVLRHKLCSCM
jgi:hypothetical protein